MEIDVSIDGKSLAIEIENPHRFDLSVVVTQIVEFGGKEGVDLSGLGMDTLVSRMIRGVAGCEGGCPADARSLVREGFRDFSLEYVEGGILTARKMLENGEPLEVKIFPDF